VDGHTEDAASLGTILYLTLVFTVICYIAIHISCFNIVFVIANIFSITLLFMYLVGISYVPYPTPFFMGIIEEVFSNPTGSMNIFMVPLAVVCVSYLIKMLGTLKRPNKVEQIKMGIVRPDEINSQ
jgi:hypothetical protein